jgi:hypothetical protein
MPINSAYFSAMFFKSFLFKSPLSAPDLVKSVYNFYPSSVPCALRLDTAAAIASYSSLSAYLKRSPP